MKPSTPADSHSAPTHYAPSVPMSVYRELASELRANKAVIDSLNSRNQQLLQQNQFLKQEIHNVVQSALSLGQAAGVARPAPHLVGQNAEPVGGMPYSAQNGFPNAIAPDTLARLAQAETGATPTARPYERSVEQPFAPSIQQPFTAPGADARRADPTPPRIPQPIKPATQKPASKNGPNASNSKGAQQKVAKPKDKSVARQKAIAARHQPTQSVGRRTEPVVAKQPSPPKPKLFTEQSGSFRSSALDAQDNKEISGIWLVLSIILIVVTAFGAGFLIMKPLLNDR